MAMKKVGAFILMGPPTEHVMEPMLNKLDTGVELGQPLAKVVDMYARTRNFQRVAEVLSIHRPDIRRAMAEASRMLLESHNITENALGAYIFDLIDKASASGQGFSSRKMAKQGSIYLRDSQLLGEFVIDVTSPDFNNIFVSRANR